MSKPNNIDIGLSVLCSITPPGHKWSCKDIADICGCSRGYIRQLEEKAKDKLRKKSLMIALMRDLNEV